MVENLGELNYTALRPFVPPPMLAALMPSSPDVAPPCPRRAAASTTDSATSPASPTPRPSPSASEHIPVSSPANAESASAVFAASAMPAAVVSVPASPLEHTDIYADTVRRCALGVGGPGRTSSSSPSSLAPTNMLSVLRHREQFSAAPRASRLAPNPEALCANLSMRRVPSWMRLAHHYQSRVFGAQFAHNGDTLAVATQDQRIRLYEVRASSISADDTDSTHVPDDSPCVGQRIFDTREVCPAVGECLEDECHPCPPSCVPSSEFGPAGWRCFKDVHARNVGWSVVDTDFSHDDRFLIYSTWSPKLQLIGCAASCEVHEAIDLQAQAKRFCVFSVKFSPDDRLVLAGSSDRHIYLYDLEHGARVAAAPAHCADINAVAWVDECGALFATGSDDCVVKLWDRRCMSSSRPMPVGCLVGHSQGITSLCSRGDGHHLLTNSKDQAAKLWDVRRMCQPKDANPREPSDAWDYRWARFKPKETGRSGPEAVAARAALASGRATPAAAAAAEAEDSAAAARAAACSLLNALLPSSASANALDNLSPAAPASSSPSPCLAPAAAASSSSSVSSSPPATAWPPASCRSGGKDLSLMTYTGHCVLETLIRAYFSPLESTGQRYIYSGSQTGVIHIWDALTGEVVRKLHGHYGTVRDVAWHPKEPILISSSWDQSLARWECP